MTGMIQLLGTALLCALLGLVLKENKGGASAAAVMTIGSLCLLGAAFVRLKPLYEMMTSLAQSGLDETVGTVGKVLGVGYVTEMGADACREMGAASVGSKLEFCGRMEILVLCLPSLRTLVEQAMEMLG